MPLKLRDGKLENAESHTLLDGDTEPTGHSVVSLSQWQANTASKATIVRLAPEDDALALRDDLSRLTCIEVSYPAYTDGRAHSQARVLRDHLGFDGEIRAIGDVRPDQVQMMLRCGIDAFDFDNPQAEQALESRPEQFLNRYKETYQTGYKN